MHTIEDLVVKRKQLIMAVMPDARIEPDTEDMLAIKSRIEPHKISQGAKEQASADHKHKR